jgi:hypothetical protein
MTLPEHETRIVLKAFCAFALRDRIERSFVKFELQLIRAARGARASRSCPGVAAPVQFHSNPK